MNRVIELLEEKNFLKEFKGVRIVDLEEYKMLLVFIIKNDGLMLYMIRDLVVVIYRKEIYDFDKCIYVVGF